MAKPLGVVLNFYADTKDAVRDINKLARETDTLGGKAKKVGGRMSTFAKVGLAGAATAATGAAVALFNMAEMAAEDRTQQQKLERIIGNVTDATEQQIGAVSDWIDQMELATQVADTDLRESLGRLVSATGDVTQAQELLALAVDTSTARGESLETVVRMLEKAIGGNTNTLKRQMPWLDKNGDGVVTLDEAVQGLSDAYGGAAAEAAKADGPMQELAIQWERMQEALGNALLPSLDQLAAWLQSPEGQRAVQGWIDATGDFATNMSNLGDELGPVINLLGDIVDAYNSLPSWMKTNPVSGLRDTWDDRPWGPRRTNERAAPNRNDDRALSSGRVINVTVNNGRQDSTANSAALALRLARTVGY